jgi:hypothetical protein
MRARSAWQALRTISHPLGRDLRYNPPREDRFGSLRNATGAALLRGPGSTPVDLRQAIASDGGPPELMTLVQKIRSAPTP